VIPLYNILYVDDEPALLELGKIFLERTGLFSVDTVTSASEALILIPEKRYDALISDYQMPGMDGIGFLKTVRASGNAIPFIIFTGRGREEVVIQALNEGADFYIQKGGEPVSQFAELSNMVKKAILQGVAEAALRSSEENFRTLVENAPDAIYIQTDNRFVYLNTAAVHLFGASSAEQLLGTTTLDRIYPSFHELINKRVRVLTIELKPVELIDEVYVKMDGSPLDVEVTAAPFRYRGENGALTFFRDITKRKQAESELRAAYDQISATESELRRQYRELAENDQKLRQSEARYRNVVEDQTELISRYLPDGTHVFVNEAYCRYFGKSQEEIIGNIFIPDIPVDDREKVKLHLASLTPSHPVESIEHRIIMPDGEVRWQRWNDRAIFDEKGNVSEFQSVGKDITDQRQAVESLKESEERYRFLIENASVAIVDEISGKTVGRVLKKTN
jgi:PAS domain S-box-containing protein